MGFFVEAEETLETQSDVQPARFDLKLLAVGKCAGLSFEEINELRIRDLLAYVDELAEDHKSKSRMATQADIDAFFA